MAEQSTEQAIRVRQITDVHANWSSQGPLENGKFSYQLILDNGAEEYVLKPTAEDTKVTIELIKRTDKVYFDLDRKVLIPSSIPLG